MSYLCLNKDYYYGVITNFCQKIYKSCKFQCIIIRQLAYERKWLRVNYRSLRAVYGSFMLLRAVYDTYGLLRVIYGKNQPVHNRQKIFDMSNILPLLSRILNSFCELFAMFAIDELTRKKNPCM